MKNILLTLILLLSSAVAFSQNSDLTQVIDLCNRILYNRPDKATMDSLVTAAPILSIKDAIAAVNSETDDQAVAKAVDAIYLINNLKKGYPLEEARDAISFTTVFPFRRPNSHDFDKLKDIFTSDSPILHKTYLRKFPFAFRNCGAMTEFMNLRDVIVNNVADCEEKTSALALLDSYKPLLAGSRAPKAILYDKDGKKRELSDYQGKTVVIDVWATWCHNCLKKMPDMLKLRDSYSDKGNVIFLTVSIDRRDKHEAWNKFSEKYALTGENNLIINSDEQSEFENSYKIFGVPRYIVIRPDGSLADAFAPGPGEELKKLIDSTL